jgi:hypothetical protein
MEAPILFEYKLPIVQVSVLELEAFEFGASTPGS